MHVLHVSPYLDPLGRRPEALLHAWPTLTDVARAAQGDSVRVTVVQASAHDAVTDAGGVEVHFVREAGPRTWRRVVTGAVPSASRRIADRVRDLTPDVLHVHGLSFPLDVRRLGRALPTVPVIVQDHADRIPRRGRRAVFRWGFRGVRGAAFTSLDQATPFVESGVLAPDVRLFAILESSSRFAPQSREEARAITGVHGDPALLWVAHLDRNKDPITVFDAVRAAYSALPDLHLWCCFRQDPLRQEVDAWLARAGRFADRVHLVGAVPHDRVEAMLSAADFFVSGSRREGSGYAAIEAAACGTPALVTDIPAFRVITDGGRVGANFPPGDATSLARAVVEWARRERAPARAATRAHFERTLSFEAVGEGLRAMYRSVLETAG